MLLNKLLALALLAGASQLAAAQSPKKAAAKLDAHSVYVVDSVTLESAAGLQRYDAATIATVDIITGAEAVKLLGERERHGIMYAETIPFVRRRYWRYFSQKSPEYRALVPTPAADSVVQYVLNKRVLTKDDVGDLSLINDKLFKELTYCGCAGIGRHLRRIRQEIRCGARSEPPQRTVQRPQEILVPASPPPRL